MDTTFTVLVDSREKKNKLKFPSTLSIANPASSKPHHPTTLRVILHEEIATLPFGDYCLKGYERYGVVEAKYGIDEISRNLTTRPRRRNFIRELDALADCSAPLILLRGSLSQYFAFHPRTTFPHLVFSSLMALLVSRSISLSVVSFATPASRTACALFVAHFLVAATLPPTILHHDSIPS